MLAVERGNVGGALRIPVPVPLSFDYVRGVNILDGIARGPLWLLVLLQVLVAMSGLKEILVLERVRRRSRGKRLA